MIIIHFHKINLLIKWHGLKFDIVDYSNGYLTIL